METPGLRACEASRFSASMGGSLRCHSGGAASAIHPRAGQTAWGTSPHRLEVTLPPAESIKQ